MTPTEEKAARVLRQAAGAPSAHIGDGTFDEFMDELAGRTNAFVDLPVDLVDCMVLPEESSVMRLMGYGKATRKVVAALRSSPRVSALLVDPLFGTRENKLWFVRKFQPDNEEAASALATKLFRFGGGMVLKGRMAGEGEPMVAVSVARLVSGR